MKDRQQSGDARATLIHIPIIHTQADLGCLKESVQRATIRKIGRQAWKRHVALIDEMWTRIERVIGGLSLRYDKVRLYQDGLPVCGREAEIVRELAEAGSRNHELLLRLMERGAAIMGTESPELLVEERELIQQSLGEGRSGRGAEIEARWRTLGNSILERRDQYIANRINSTLGAGETGILFLGMLHSLEGRLDQGIRVVYPINRPLDGGGKGNGGGQISSSYRGR